jgi:medium-chain acyl-[acyl-carrier-protein] hydrolase
VTVPSTPWLRKSDVRPDARLRLFCFPYAGGNSSMYRGWAGRLPPGVGLCPVLLPGREERLADAPLAELNALADAVTLGLHGVMDRPFALFGHSLGALLAFEVARRLVARGGRLPALIYASGCEAPTHRLRTAPLTGLDTPAFLARLKALGGTPEMILAHPDLMKLMLPMLRADFAASETYRFVHGDPLPIPLVALVGTEDPEVEIDRAADWKARTSEQFRMHRLPGDHFFVTSPAVLDVVNVDLSAVVARMP